MRPNDPAALAWRYANESNLGAPRSMYANAHGPDPRELAFEAVAEMRPARVLEAGCGPGVLSARVRSREAVEAHGASRGGPGGELPHFVRPLRATCATTIFVAETA